MQKQWICQRIRAFCYDVSRMFMADKSTAEQSAGRVGANWFWLFTGTHVPVKRQNNMNFMRSDQCDHVKFLTHTLENHFWTSFRTSVGQLVQFISVSPWRWERRIMSCVCCCGRRPRCQFCTLSVGAFVCGGRREGNKKRKVLKEWRKGHFFGGVIIAFCVKTLVPNQQSRKRKKKNVLIIKLKSIWCVNSLNFRKKGFIIVLMWAVTGTGTTFRMAVMLVHSFGPARQQLVGSKLFYADEWWVSWSVWLFQKIQLDKLWDTEIRN